MSRKTNDNIKLQMDHFQKAAMNRLGILKERSNADDEIKKDPVLKSLQARIKQIRKRSAAVKSVEETYKAVALRKDEKVDIRTPKRKAMKKKKVEYKVQEISEQE